jgi:type VI protein secretion system component VasA
VQVDRGLECLTHNREVSALEEVRKVYRPRDEGRARTLVNSIVGMEAAPIDQRLLGLVPRLYSAIELDEHGDYAPS